MRFDEYSYHSLSRVYDGLAAFYSFGEIGASKRVQLESIRRGDRVLYAGAGAGKEILLAARLGARVTAIDLADSMLSQISIKLANEGLSSELIRGDVAQHAPANTYDVVVANYFLNLFDLEHAREMTRHLCRLVAPGGTLVLTDFALPEGGLFARLIAEVYYRPVNWIAWALGFCARHPILDHEKGLAEMNFRVASSQRFPVLFGRTPAYVAIVARRCDDARVP
jgi:demethylmenaquinone methyltransferase/2-methoxy-6-polyprenyl-1,4-benzoquinol methylase